MWIRWFFQVFTREKSFKNNVILGSSTLNHLGLHVVRVVAAHLFANIRRAALMWKIPRELRKRFRRDGFVVVPEFVSQPSLDIAAEEIRQFQGKVRQYREGSTAITRVQLDNDALKELPTLAKIISSADYRNLLAYGASTLTRTPILLQRLAHNFFPDEKDPQKSFHTDTFQPTMKSWIFMEEVT